MAFTYGFYNSVSGDRVYSAEQLSAIFDGIITEGIFQAFEDAFAVTPDADMDIFVGAGRAWLNSTWNFNSADFSLTVDDADIALPRIDTVVIEVNKDSASRVNAIKIIKGTPASSPVAPTLSAGTNDLWQHPLADIYVGAGVTSISAGNITNRIGSDTPFITGILTTIDMTWLFAQWEADFDAWFTNLVDQLTGTQVTNLQAQLDLLNNQQQGSQHNLIAEPITGWSYANSTVTFPTAASEGGGVANAPNDQVTKVVTTVSGGGTYQDFIPANFPLLIASQTKVSLGVWVWTSDPGDITVTLYDSVTGALDSYVESTEDAWVFVSLENVTIGANTLQIIITHGGAIGSTFYICNPMLNTGNMVMPFGAESSGVGGLYPLSHNLIKNYPSLEFANGVKPEWWEVVGAPTLTETSRTAQGLPLTTPNERVLKVVTNNVNQGLEQTFSPSVEALLMAGTTKISAGVWVYAANPITLQLRDSSPANLGSISSTLANQWQYLKLENITIGSNTLQFRVYSPTSGQTFFIANPVLNVGPVVNFWKPRGLTPRYSSANMGVNAVDPGGTAAGWIPVTAPIGANGVMVNLLGVYMNTTTLGKSIAVRRYGDTATSVGMVQNQTISASVFTRGSAVVMLDDQQRYEYASYANAGDAETLYIACAGVYWEWE